MRDLPRSGIEPVVPALAGGFLSTAPPAKLQAGIYLVQSGPQNWVRYTGSAQPNMQNLTHPQILTPHVHAITHSHNSCTHSHILTGSCVYTHTHTHTHTQALQTLVVSPD